MIQLIFTLPWPIYGQHDATMFAFASVALEEHGVFIAGTRSVDCEWFGVSFPKPCNKAVKAVTFMLKPLQPGESGKPRTNFTFLLKIEVGAPEGSLGCKQEVVAIQHNITHHSSLVVPP